MKLLLPILWLCLTHLNAAEKIPIASLAPRDHQPFRIIGTNLFDFTPLIKDYLSTGRKNTNVIEGTALFVGEPGVVVEQIVRTRYKFTGNINDATSTRDTLRMVSLANLQARNPEGITAGELLIVDPVWRPYFKPVQYTENILVTNAIFQTGKSGYFIAWPIPARTFHLKEGKTETLRCYDYGTPYKGSLTNFQFYWQVTPTNLNKVKIGKRS